jgi:thioredoxin reductase
MGFENLMIIGSGCEGLTAAIYVGRANLDPLVIEGDQRGGQLIRMTNVGNFPGFPEDINGFNLMSNMRVQAEKICTCFRSGIFERIDLKGRSHFMKAIGLNRGQVLYRQERRHTYFIFAGKRIFSAERREHLCNLWRCVLQKENSYSDWGRRFRL